MRTEHQHKQHHTKNKRRPTFVDRHLRRALDSKRRAMHKLARIPHSADTIWRAINISYPRNHQYVRVSGPMNNVVACERRSLKGGAEAWLMLASWHCLSGNLDAPEHRHKQHHTKTKGDRHLSIAICGGHWIRTSGYLTISAV